MQVEPSRTANVALDRAVDSCNEACKVSARTVTDAAGNATSARSGFRVTR